MLYYGFYVIPWTEMSNPLLAETSLSPVIDQAIFLDVDHILSGGQSLMQRNNIHFNLESYLLFVYIFLSDSNPTSCLVSQLQFSG